MGLLTCNVLLNLLAMIKAIHLTKDYGPFRAVDHISFEVNKGDVLGFLGPNGAGKSTTMKMLTGFLPPTSGTAFIGDHEILKTPIEAKRQLGYLPESGPLYQEMTVMEFLKFISEMRGFNKNDGKKAIDRVIDVCHLEEVQYQPIETLSKGYRQRVGMAQAVIHNPSYLVMDEPTDGLDPNQKQEVRKLIASMAQEKAIILSTHILEEVQAMCNRVIIISEGKILADEKPEELLKRHPRYNMVKLSLREGDLSSVKNILQNIDGVGKIEETNGTLLVSPRKRENLKERLWDAARENRWQVTTLENEPLRLEEVFRELTQTKSN